MQFNDVITKFRENKKLPVIRLKGGSDSDISTFKDYLAEKGKQTRQYTLIYVIILVALVLFSVVTVALRDNLSASFKYVFAGEGAGVLVLVRLLFQIVKIGQNSMDLFFLVNYFSDKPDEQKKVLDAMIDDIKERAK